MSRPSSPAPTPTTASAPGRVAPGPGTAPQVELRFALDVPPAEAFDLVTRRLPEWFQAVHRVTYDNARSERGPGEIGACSTRVCAMGDKTLVEDIVAYDPGKSYSYRIDMARSSMKMPISNHLGRFEIEPRGTGSRVTWRQYFEPPLWPMSLAVRWMLRDRMMVPALRQLFARVGGRFDG